MKLDLSVSNFSNRLVFENNRFCVSNSWKKFVPYWMTDSTYDNQNRRAIKAFETQMSDLIGVKRLERICNHYQINFLEMQKKGQSLNTRIVAKIFTGIQDVRAIDIQNVIDQVKKGEALPSWIPESLLPMLKAADSFEELNPDTFAQVHAALASPVRSNAFVEPVSGVLSGAAKASWCFTHDQFAVDRERLQLVKDHRDDDFETFVHNMSVRVIKREMEVGMLIPAPGGFFYRVAAKLVTGEGQVSYVCVPATKVTDLKAIRFFRGTSPRPSEVDALSTLITDTESNLGQSAYESGLSYEEEIRKHFPNISIYAGHSLGAVIASKSLLTNETVQEAYLFNGPGIKKKEVDQFNTNRKKPITLHIRHAERDRVSLAGETHLGYQAPANVAIDYVRYSLKKGLVNPHVFVPNKPDCTRYPSGSFAEGHEYQKYYFKKSHNLFLTNETRPEERYRVRLGPLISYCLKSFRRNIRMIFSCRIRTQKGLQIERFD